MAASRTPKRQASDRGTATPDLPGSEANATALGREIDWFTRVLEARISQYFEQTPADGAAALAPPPLEDDQSEYARIVAEHGFGADERLILTLALLPHLRPQALDTFFIRNKNLDRPYTEFGGWRGKTHAGFLPTCETAAFVLAGEDLARRLEVMRLFDPDHSFQRHGILRIDHDASGEPFFSGTLAITGEYLNALTTGRQQKPDYGVDFPARRVVTALGWNDLVLAPQTLEDVDLINVWLKHAGTILDDWGLARSIAPGYRTLFYGPPGTGKTLTATLLGAENGADVYRIDLSMLVSKYIGETEKNLARVFDQARTKNWILFFDEADALFGKRTQVSSSHDRYANQEVSYLLQRVEDHPGVVILATNLRANIDDAFVRRFQGVIHFPMPDPDQRLRLWEGILGTRSPRAKDIDARMLAERYEISGGAITNVVRFAAIRAARRKTPLITQADLLDGITRERLKEGKTS